MDSGQRPASQPPEPAAPSTPAGRGEPSAGRHRKPVNPRSMRLARIAIVCGAIAVLVGVVVEVVRLTSDNSHGFTAPRPDSPAASLTPVIGAPTGATSGTTGRPGGLATLRPTTGGSTSPSADPSPSPSSASSDTPAVAVTTPRGAPAAVADRAATAISRLSGLMAPAESKAPIATAPLGERVVTAPGRELGSWESRKLTNGMTIGANNDRALRAGRVVTSAQLPTATTVARVRLPSGERYSAPVASARQVFDAMREVGGPACPTCQDVIVSAVRPTTMSTDTDGGPVTLPAWEFTVRGSTVRLVRPAVTQAGLVRFTPSYRGVIPAQVDAEQLPLWRTTVSKDGRYLAARLERKDVAERGGCWRLFASQSEESVALYAARGPADDSGACAGANGAVWVRLDAPLGDRPVIDTYWQRVLDLR